MRESIVEFWARFAPVSGTLSIHPDDENWMRTFWAEPLDQQVLLGWEEYIGSSRFGSRDSKLHLSLLPIPFMGNLETATIVICLANPGFAAADYYLEEHKSFDEELRKNLLQEQSMHYPFVYLNPKFAWSEAFSWWEARLRPVIDELMMRGNGYQEALQLLSKQIAVLELFPYHSRDGSELKGLAGKNVMPSVKKAKEFFSELTHQKGKLTLLMRSHAHWHQESCSPLGEHYLHGPRTQALSFHPKFEVGAAILRALKGNQIANGSVSESAHTQSVDITALSTDKRARAPRG